MRQWRDIGNQSEAHGLFREVAKGIASGSLDLGRRHYAQNITIAVLEGILCGIPSISLAEFGIAHGAGLQDMCKAAKFFRDEFAYDLRVIGFDNGTGLPEPVDFRDHPEMWMGGQFALHDIEPLRKQLPDFATLVIGDVGDTVADIRQVLSDSPLGFAAIDVDFYSSTKRMMPVFDFDPECYLPATPVYPDDIEQILTLNSWCGEALAIREFNDSHACRKIEANAFFKIPRFHVLHVLDHPLRTGVQKPRAHFPIFIVPLF